MLPNIVGRRIRAYNREHGWIHGKTGALHWLACQSRVSVGEKSAPARHAF